MSTATSWPKSRKVTTIFAILGILSLPAISLALAISKMRLSHPGTT